MKKIYFDNCVFQDLKREKNKALLEKVIAAKSYVIFPFSEAHLHDLNRDQTQEKYADMKFIELISESNCYSFTDRTKFRYRTPTEFYSDFEWPDMSQFEEIVGDLSGLFLSQFKTIPLPIPDLAQDHHFPADMPESMRNLLTQPSTFYDFAMLLFEMTNGLINDQQQFRELLKYLHANSSLTDFYKSAGIEGYDGTTVTDKKLFWSSYAKKFIAEGKEKTRYDLYIDMFHCLDVFGFVKGKPKKQKMMNLINDARHSFFGTVCDVIVSKDSDFLEKTRFMYNIEEVRTKVVDIKVLPDLLDDLAAMSQLPLQSLFDEITAPLTEDKIYHVQQDNNEERIYVRLKNTYCMYFNMMIYINDEDGSYRSICKEPINYSTGTLVKQIEYIISKLLGDLGPDFHQKGKFNKEEDIKDKTELRSWISGDLVISLILDEKLYLNFYSLECLQKKWARKKEVDLSEG